MVPMQKNKNNAWLAFLVIAVVSFISLSVMAAPPVAATGMADLKHQLDQSEITGEIAAIQEYKGDLLVVLKEWPVTIRITNDTVFDSTTGMAISRYSAKDMLPGKAVAIVRQVSETGEVLATKLTVLSREKLREIKKLQAERMAKTEVRHKDAIVGKGQ